MGDSQKPELPNSILFLCNHNAIRSPMGEALMKHMFPRRIFAQSAGLSTGSVDPFVISVMAEIEVDVKNHKPTRLEDLDDTWFDIIVSFSREAHDEAQKMSHVKAAETLFWPADDPTIVQGSRDQMLSAYRDVRNAIHQRLLERFGDQSL